MFHVTPHLCCNLRRAPVVPPPFPWTHTPCNVRADVEIAKMDKLLAAADTASHSEAGAAGAGAAGAGAAGAGAGVVGAGAAAASTTA